MRTWMTDPNLELMADDEGDIISSGSFGHGTFGLTTTVDGREVEFRLVLAGPPRSFAHARKEADELLERLAQGWRPEGWGESGGEP